MAEPSPYRLLLLAAGGSRRMGQPKQLLPIHGQPLVRLMAEAAVAAHVAPVIVVLGAEAERVRSVLNDLPLQVVINADWSSGLSSSLRRGVEKALADSPELQAVIVCLADQPNLSGKHLRKMITRFEQGQCTAVTTVAQEITLPPILFDRSWFAKLCSLQGDIGARALLQNSSENVATVPIDSAADLDTPEDYTQYIARNF